MTAISVNDVSFGYQSNQILSHISARIPDQKIYGLLGPSGAGKTSLLRLILGRIKPKSGSIKVLGCEPGVNNPITGYMPQDTALCLSFTVGKTIAYFANIYRMSDKNLNQRKTMLSSILQLPDDNQRVSDLSGGQQKRVSLALAFLNSLRLVILDEPTVGTDPLLGKSIWDYLHSCCAEGVSVVIVTHYIQEAASAHVVGIMRNGRLLEEGKPNDLLLKYRETNLENVFIKLCQIDEKDQQNVVRSEITTDGIAEEVVVVGNAQHKNNNLGKHNDRNNIMLNLWILWILIRKNFAKFLGFNVSFLIFLVPAVQALLLCLTYDRDSIPIKTAVFNQELQPEYSDRLLASIEKVNAYYVEPVPYKTLQEAINAVDRGHAMAAIHFSANYSPALDQRITSAQDLDITSEIFNESSIHLWLDNSYFMYAHGVMDSLRTTLYRMVGEIFLEHNMTRVDAPLEVVETVYAKESKISDFLLPGYLICFIYLSQVSLSSQLLIQERNDGLFERSLVAGVSHHLVFISHFVTNCLMSLIQIILMLIISFVVFQLTNYGSIQLILVLVMAQAVNAIATGLLISSLVREGFVALLISISVTFSQLFTSGAIFPFELVAPELRQFLYFSPIAMPTESLRNVMLRGWYLWHWYVFHGLALNLCSGLLYIAMAMLFFRRNS